ncbi:spore coat protein [Bacillus suaedae]|uniref:Spore coat protein n=1 Tax=Halalkalibacter suaedae TaxID=2822140 RepID=A0A940WT19_9BACI|nr:spore coat protein [Bacillus suaedae]MBP3952219.1 spore coat protein [Bacillus suaedae]
MILKSIDLSLMSEHLNVHKGILNKLDAYYCNVQDQTLKKLIYDQYVIMWNHVEVMLSLMDPNLNEQVTAAALNNLEQLAIPCKQVTSPIDQATIAIDLRETSKSMAQSNFNSALRMKTSNVREIHIQMALQQTMFHKQYSLYVERTINEVVPESTLQGQLAILQSFRTDFNI